METEAKTNHSLLVEEVFISKSPLVPALQAPMMEKQK